MDRTSRTSSSSLALLIQAHALGMRSVRVRQAEYRLRRAEDEKAVAFGDVRDRRDDLLLGGLVEVDQDVSAEHDIEAAKGACILQQVEMPEADHRPEGGRNGPHVVPFLEVGRQVPSGQAPWR